MNLDECDRIFAQVRGALSPSDVCHALTPLFDYYEVINIELNRGWVFWRARSTEGHPWAAVAEMGYPPPEIAKRNRLSDESMPSLYAATRLETALLEIDAKEQDLVQLVCFMAKLEIPIRIAVIGELQHVERTGYLRLIGRDPDRSMIRFLNSKGLEVGRRLLYIDAFLAHLLADPEAQNSDYVRSRAVAAMIYRNKDIDGIMFPSVRDQLGMNLVLRAMAFDSKMQPVCCLHTKVTRIRSFGFIEYKVLTEAESLSPDGSMFVWRDPLPPPLRRRFFNLTKEEYEIAAQQPDDPNTFMEAMSVYSNED